MILVFLDGKDEQVQLLSWNTIIGEENLIKCHGNQITFSGNEAKVNIIETSQAIPDALNSFSFSTKLKSKTEDLRVDIGFKFEEGNYIRWRGDGNLDNEIEYPIADLELITNEDLIECQFHKIIVGQKSYKYIKFFKNRKIVGSHIVDCQFAKPFVSFLPLKDEPSVAEVETSFTNISSFGGNGIRVVQL